MANNFQWKASSVSGTKKPENDDDWAVISSGLNGSEILSAEGTFSNNNEDIIFAISDGMGGGNAGHLASSLIMEHLSKIIPQTFKSAAEGFHPDYLEKLELVIEQIHNEINLAASKDEAHHGMAATLTLAWFTPENLYLAHVGDSRLYLHRDEETTQLTDDHTLVWKKFNRGEITEMQLRSNPRRSILYQIVGAGNRPPRPQIEAIPYQKGDLFMLCTDGIIDGTWQKNIQAGFINHSNSPQDLHDELLQTSLANAGTDDTTIIALSIS